MESDPIQKKNPARDILLVLIVFVVYFIISWPALTTALSDYNEGFQYLAGYKINLGQAPFRDFYHRITPGSIYIYAWAFRLFGYDAIVPRAVSMLNDALILLLLLTYLLTVSRWRIVTLVTGIAYVFWGIIQYYYLWYTKLALVTVLAALILLMIRKKNAGFATHAVVGLLCFVTFWFKQNVGPVILMGFWAFYLADGLEEYKFEGGGERSMKRLIRRVALPVIASLSGFVVGLGIFLFYLQATGSLRQFIDMVFIEAFNTKKDTFNIIVTGKIAFLTYFFGLGSLILVQYRIESYKRYTIRHSRHLMGIIVILVMFCTGIMSGADFTHLIHVITCAFFLMGIFFGNVLEIVKDLGWSRFRVLSVNAIMIAVAGLIIGYGITRSRQNISMNFEWDVPATQTERLNLPRARYARVSPERKQAYVNVVNAVEKIAGPDDCVLVFPFDVMFNFLLLRDNCVSFSELHSQMLDDKKIRLIIDELKSNNVKYIILKDYTMKTEHTHGSGEPLYRIAHELFQYIWDNYEKKDQFLYWQIYARKDAGSASPSPAPGNKGNN